MPSPRSLRALLGAALLPAACARPVSTTPTPSDPVAALRASIDSMADAPEFRNAHWGILIVDPERGDTLYSRNAGKLFMPASNQKLITGAVALAQLGSDYRWRTTLQFLGNRRDSTLDGNLFVIGTGDPSMSDAMRGGDTYAVLRGLADSLRARGIAAIDGRVMAAGDAFPDAPLGFGWAWDDLDYAYSAGTDELMLNEGFGEVIVTAGPAVGDSARARLRLPGSVTLINGVKTVAARVANGPPVTRVQWDGSASTAGRNVLALTGTIGLGETDTISAAFREQNAAFVDALAAALAERGIRVHGRSEVTRGVISGPRADDVVLLSPPLREILPRMEKPSQNQLAEAFFKTLGLEKTGVGSADSGRAVVERQLVAWGAQPTGFAVRDGSGLSRHDYVTPETIVKVLDAMRRHEHSRLFYESLPVAGVDGTIRNRMRDTPAQGNVHAKTGFVDKARSLSGYVTTADGRLLLFSFLANNWTTPTRAVERVQDAIAVRLASMRLAR